MMSRWSLLMPNSKKKSSPIDMLLPLCLMKFFFSNLSNGSHTCAKSALTHCVPLVNALLCLSTSGNVSERNVLINSESLYIID